MDCGIGTCPLTVLVTLGSAAGLKWAFKHMNFGRVFCFHSLISWNYPQDGLWISLLFLIYYLWPSNRHHVNKQCVTTGNMKNICRKLCSWVEEGKNCFGHGSRDFWNLLETTKDKFSMHWWRFVPLLQCPCQVRLGKHFMHHNLHTFMSAHIHL
jgi:hypothetical protein